MYWYFLFDSLLACLLCFWLSCSDVHTASAFMSMYCTSFVCLYELACVYYVYCFVHVYIKIVFCTYSIIDPIELHSNILYTICLSFIVQYIYNICYTFIRIIENKTEKKGKQASKQMRKYTTHSVFNGEVS